MTCPAPAGADVDTIVLNCTADLCSASNRPVWFFNAMRAALPVSLLQVVWSIISIEGLQVSYRYLSKQRKIQRSIREWILLSSNSGDVEQGPEEEWRPNMDKDSFQWMSIDDKAGDDWETVLRSKEDGSFWTSFEPSPDELAQESLPTPTIPSDDDLEAEVWLDTLQSLTAEEVEFSLKEADRADKVRQMLDWGFDSETIANTLDVAMDNSTEIKDEMEGMQAYRESSYLETVDFETVESHTTVEVDEETGEPIRSQMVYVDEHACIGCTNCAMIAQSTFFMHSEHGRARVFQQWGDDDETIQIAIETCPVDCIHYIPYDELVELEKDRRSQNINFKARLVSQAENGNALSHLTGGGQFTAPQKISGNQSPRCNNCPSRGCKNCPMYGVGENPAFKQREAERLAKRAKRQLLAQREREEKSAEL